MTTEQILKARQQLGLNQSEMARALGVARNHYLKWERGEQRITAAPVASINMLLYMQRCGSLEGWLSR
jgi:transcriptional regulator with XRE-family HTH domain